MTNPLDVAIYELYNADMSILPTTQEGVIMSIVRTNDALQILSDAYKGDIAGKTRAKLWHLREEQVRMIEQLADRYSESQITILRAIIDEWREMKLKEAQ